MNTTLETLVTTLINRFAEAGFDVPIGMNPKEREAFVFHALEEAAIVPLDRYNRLVEAGRGVVQEWASKSLAEQVRSLAKSLAELPYGKAD